MRVIGVTGGVGCGKSVVLEELKNVCACRIVRTDDVANAVKEPGGICYNKMIALLGEDVLEDAPADDAAKTDVTANAHARRIDRAKMAKKIFADEALLEKVNAILHPAVRSVVADIIEEERAKNDLDVLFIEAALLLENGYASETRRDAIEKAGIRPKKENGLPVDEMWYVFAPEDVRRKRLKAYRGYPDEKTDAIMARQLSEEQFRAGSDFVIDNGGTLEEAVNQGKARIRKLTK